MRSTILVLFVAAVTACSSGCNEAGDTITLVREEPFVANEPYLLRSVSVEPDTGAVHAMVSDYPAGEVDEDCLTNLSCVRSRSVELVVGNPAHLNSFVSAARSAIDVAECTEACRESFTLTVGDESTPVCCVYELAAVFRAAPSLLEAAAHPAFPRGEAFTLLEYDVRGDLENPTFDTNDFAQATISRTANAGLNIEGLISPGGSSLNSLRPYGPRTLTPQEQTELEKLVREFPAPMNISDHTTSADCVELRRLVVDGSIAEELCSAFPRREVYDAFEEFAAFLRTLP